MRSLRSMLIVVLLATAGLAVWLPAEARFRRTAALSSQQGATVFLRSEYWTCPAENLEGFRQATDSIWGPIFDELVAEGQLLAWSVLTPTAAFEFDTSGGQPRQQSVAPPWNWVISWQATSEAAFDSAWTLVVERLRARFPDDPRPWRFCDGLTTVNYDLRSSF